MVYIKCWNGILYNLDKWLIITPFSFKNILFVKWEASENTTCVVRPENFAVSRRVSLCVCVRVMLGDCGER
jgi:hypothetical protein